MRFYQAFLTFFLLVSYSGQVWAQAPIYDAFSVDSAAAPQGGARMLETFITVNLEKPFLAQVANITGKVFIKAVVEANGAVSDVTVLRGLRPDCDHEAARVIRLFNAWKPAMKGGLPVRQGITYSVAFRPNTPIIYVNGKRITYFDKDTKPTPDRQVAAFQQTVPVDSITGLPTGELILEKLISHNNWTEVTRLPLKRIINNFPLTDGASTYTIGHKQADDTWYNYAYTLDSTGAVRRRDSDTGEEVTYGPTGLVVCAKKLNGNSALMYWHTNGQLSQVITPPQLPTGDSFRLISAWDSTGRPLVVNGNGLFTHHDQAKSRASDRQSVGFIETGHYVGGVKDGLWKGMYSDSSYAYEESFDKGKRLGGSAVINRVKKVTYAGDEQSPQFNGGLKALYNFLGQNITYPTSAVKAGIQGKVFVTFTVCTDGTLCDYELLKGVDPSIDKEALRVVRQMNGRWQPGYQRGEPVRVKYKLPIDFRFN